MKIAEECHKVFIDGAWVSPQRSCRAEIVNPATEQAIGTVEHGSAADVDSAVHAAHRAFPSWSRTPMDERLALLERVGLIYERRAEDLAQALSAEMGAPIDFARGPQVSGGLANIRAYVGALRDMRFRSPAVPDSRTDMILKEAVGVCALITPWNWPLNQITLKVGAALAAGATMVLKPSELTPLTGRIFAEILDEADLPPGVFNMVQGTGASAGQPLVDHPKVDAISFTGSTIVGRQIMLSAAQWIKRVTLELGGKNPAILLDDADISQAMPFLAALAFRNSGQSCNAPSRILVHESRYEEAIETAICTARDTAVGDPARPGEHIGPVVSHSQYARVQSFIRSAVDQGARLVVGGLGRPDGMEAGYYVRPTVFCDTMPGHSVYDEEVFGPVICLRSYRDVAEAVRFANDTKYGLAAYLYGGPSERLRDVARSLRAGMVHVNGQLRKPGTPFGGYKMSGLGREGGSWGIEEFLETKSVSGWPV